MVEWSYAPDSASVDKIPILPLSFANNDTLRRFQGRDKGYYIPPETLGILPKGGALRSPEGGPRGSREVRTLIFGGATINDRFQSKTENKMIF
jgi:hypothetical protein